MRVKRRDLIRELGRMAARAGMPFVLVRHGADHDQYRLGRMLIPVPRHREVNERTAQGILRDARRFVEEEAR
jgi:mRNA interferase HicA